MAAKPPPSPPAPLPKTQIPAVVGQVVQSLKGLLAPPAPRPEQVAAAEILGEDPGLRRKPDPASTAATVLNAWDQAVRAPVPAEYRLRYAYAVNSGNGQTGKAGKNLPKPLAIRVTDIFNQPVQAVAVTFAVTAGGGKLTKMNVQTDAHGVATAGTWKLGPRGINTVEASVNNFPVVRFWALAT